MTKENFVELDKKKEKYENKKIKYTASLKKYKVEKVIIIFVNDVLNYQFFTRF